MRPRFHRKASDLRIPCPLCGPRDVREFTYRGDETYLARPAPGDAAGYDGYLHLRDNPAGVVRELWYHGAGCGSWLVVRRDTRTHEIIGVALPSAEAGA
ncbi:sarcosine oxidase subunit delta [Dinoroseobacter sp. S124A]|uniref:sarcosine oxidase subunit delta n=1 Tax=Dinoroseobacter sp. S124A TaxID=3415128 RepID=UPI003C7A4411